MKITEVNISLIKPHEGLIGFASLVINNAIYLGSIGIHQKLDNSGYRLTYPNKRFGNQKIDVFHPIDHDTSRNIEAAVFNKLKEK